VYKLFVRNLFIDSLEDEDERAGWYIVEAGLTEEMNSDDVVRYFVSRFVEIEMEVDDAIKRTLCLKGKPRYEGAENFVIFNQMEEVRLNIYQKHLLLARSDLVASGLFNLDQALQDFPVSFTSRFMNHREAKDGSVQRTNDVAKEICSNPWGLHFSSSKSVSQNQD
jgi:hypothetical protein